MNEKIVGVLNTLLKQDVEVEKLTDETYIATLEEKAKGMKVHTNEEFLSINNNLRAQYKDSVYAEVKASSFESFEKDLMKEHGLDGFKFGKEYQNTKDLVNQIIGKNKAGGNQEEYQKEISTLRNALVSKNEEVETIKSESKKQIDNTLADIKLTSAISMLKDKIDLPETLKDKQLKTFKLALSNEYNIKRDDQNNFIVYSKETNEKVLNESFMPLSIEDVVNKVASDYLPIKKSVPRGGRGEDNTTEKNNNQKTVWSKYPEWNDYLKTEQGKGLIAGTLEHDTQYLEYKKSKV